MALGVRRNDENGSPRTTCARVGVPARRRSWRASGPLGEFDHAAHHIAGGVRRHRTLASVSYDHVLLPSGVASTITEVDAFLAAQQGIAETQLVARIAAELNARNAGLPEADTFLSTAPVGGAATGAALQVSAPYDAIGFVRQLLFEIATPLNYAIYDPQLAWLIDPAGHVPVTVTHGGAGEFPYLTENLANQWVSELAPPNPYLVVERTDQDYIQTYREKSGGYTLEYRAGGPDKHFGTRVGDAPTVATMIWSWTTGDPTPLQTLPWTSVEL